jgi:hypothetical protein
VLEGDVVVLGGAAPTGWHSGQVDATPWGVRGVAAADPLPLPLAVGAALLGDRPHRLLAVDGSAVVLPPGASVLVVGDGTAKRTEKAPGQFDPRAAAVDEALVAALRRGLPQDLALDPVLARELMVEGLDVWRSVAASLAGTVEGTFAAEVLYADAPFGVGYAVATWIGS